MAKKKILIVDDEITGRELLRAIFIMEGFETILAENGLEAIEKSKNELPDLILLDVMMPKMNGYEVTKIIREDENLQKTPIILVTALEDRNSKALGLEAGANSYISKPFNKTNIIDTVNSLLSPK